MFKRLSQLRFTRTWRIPLLDYTFHTASASSHLRITDGHLKDGITPNSWGCLIFLTRSQQYALFQKRVIKCTAFVLLDAGLTHHNTLYYARVFSLTREIPSPRPPVCVSYSVTQALVACNHFLSTSRYLLVTDGIVPAPESLRPHDQSCSETAVAFDPHLKKPECDHKPVSQFDRLIF